VAAAVPDILTGLAAIERIDEVLENTDREPYGGGRAVELAGAVEWDGVTFGYAREEAPVLSDVSLAVEPGETLAILGPTGAGKTTLVMLLLGLYRPWSGSIAVDGAPLERIDVRALRRQTGVLLQDGAAMRGTVAENIAFGRPDASREQIEAAAALAAAEDFVAELPDGYETDIGDDGVRLSAGQRQRVALARALLGNPALLVLDEPTSHLDPSTADRVLDNLTTLEPRPTLLLVTHDPLVARRADRQVEVRGGRVAAPVPGLVEEGA
jgi:ATP-binding cassette subfamily B protein